MGAWGAQDQAGEGGDEGSADEGTAEREQPQSGKTSRSGSGSERKESEERGQEKKRRKIRREEEEGGRKKGEEGRRRTRSDTNERGRSER